MTPGRPVPPPLALKIPLEDGAAEQVAAEVRPRGGAPVSYTHLDVYKRQAGQRPAPAASCR
ncbi:hypothetical protein B1A87_004390 [Arthrobacter sp. KBS0703]|uniref:hypothetical protein n=1 Tax=Arthrobacter sp. KBS0703 TaxID=1955698 RepID=UPI0011866226|nr:hypothetical protein [Arthrobacter sp. KBS0703]TSE15271.1 hypothetical protein B1A87_004390 [Arthrobacter sp. KBS0703]